LTRLSIDAYIHAHHGLYKIDYPDEKYEPYQIEAESSLRQQLENTLRSSAQRDGNLPPYVILDFSFAHKETRDEWKNLIEQGGGRWILVYMDVEFDEIRRRVRERNHQRETGVRKNDADAAYDVTKEVLEMYIQGFERPVGEGEINLRL
jgi:predicted kinase